ncbi:MAG: hypothetical protein LC799_23145, partial [Actinobacteria bacterium]|nr:hypothetical protein [Actinomycetota bacterium]
AYTDAEGNVVPYPEEEGEEDPDPLEDDDVITRRVLGAVTVALFGEAALDRPIMQSGAKLLGELEGIPLITGSTARKLDKHDVAWIRGAADSFRKYQLEYGGRLIYAAVRGLADKVVAALQDSPPERDLYVATSGLCRMAAWTAFEAGHKRDFWQCHATALDLARESGHTGLILTTVEVAGRIHIHMGHHRDAAKLFELMSARRAPDAVGWGLLGSAYAPNTPHAARHALVRLRDAEGADTVDAISMIGHVSNDLGDYSTAVAAYEQVLPQRFGLIAVQETAPTAVAHLAAGERNLGLRYAEQALDLANNVNSTLYADSLRRLSTTLAAQQDSTAQDLARRAAAVSQVV